MQKTADTENAAETSFHPPKRLSQGSRGLQVPQLDQDKNTILL